MKTAKITAALSVGLALLLSASPASAAFSIVGFNASSTSTVAGAHPDLTTDLIFGGPSAPGEWSLDGNVRELFVDTPPGFLGDPSAAPQCTQSQFVQGVCPPTSQVGSVFFMLTGNRDGGFEIPFELPVFNMQPRHADVTGELAFSFGGIITIHLPIAVRSDGDYGLTVIDTGIARAYGLGEVKLTVWGVPADASHDPKRTDMGLNPIPPPVQPRVPFYTNPTHCAGALELRARANSYQDPTLVEKSTTLPAITNCDEFEFEPSLKARPTTNAADSPSGLDVDLKLPQNEDADGRATAQLRDAEVTLPEGLVVNPASANGLGACSPAQIGLTTAVGDRDAHFDLAKPSCPDAASIGSVEIDTPVFDDPLKGTVYLASPHQNPFGSLLALYLVIEGHGLKIKLPGKISADPQTGRLSAGFEENPQLPFEHLRMNLFGGALAPLSTPAACGTYATTSVMTPWSAPDSGAPATPKDEYEISQGANGGACGAQANAPAFSAGSVAPLAGVYQPFVVNLHREDGTQRFASVTVSPPPGLVAKLAGTATCSDADLAAAAAKSGEAEKSNPSCPSASQIGNVYAQAGSGPAPYNAPGKAYLTGPYKGAPLSLAIVTPATAGPFDLGTIVVRTALFLDPKTAQVTAKSDPIPTILQGIPLDIRAVSIRLDKPGFTLNPSTCDPSEVSGSLFSSAGNSASLQSRFQLAECGQLKFKPGLTLSLKGPTSRAKYPALTAVLTPRAGDANIASVSVALPHSEFLAQEHIRTVCTRVQWAADQCPAAAIYGKVSVTTPLLDYPLTGPVYLRSSDNPLPDLVPDLRGPANQPIRFEAAGRTDSVKGGIRNSFDFVPDVPFTRLTLQLQGGKKGLLVNSRDICAAANKADVSYTAHNGLTYSAQPLLKAKCGAKARKGKGKGKHGKGKGKHGSHHG